MREARVPWRARAARRCVAADACWSRSRSVAIVGPFVWILTASFKYQIAIYAGAVSVHADAVQLRRRAVRPPLRLRRQRRQQPARRAREHGRSCWSIGTLAAYSLHRFRWPALGHARLPRLDARVPHGPGADADRSVVRRLPRARARTTRRAALVLTHVTINLPMTVWLMTRVLPRDPAGDRGGRARRRLPAAAGVPARRRCRWPSRD